MHLLEDQDVAGGEIQLTEAMARLIGDQPFHSHVFAGDRHDCGEKTGYVQANIALLLEREDMAPHLRAFLSEI